MVEQKINEKLRSSTELAAFVEGRIFPTQAVPNAPALPNIVYTVTPAENTLFTTGSSSLTKYGLQIDCYAIDLKKALEVLAVVKTVLNGWRSRPDGVQWCKFDSQATAPQELGNFAQHNYTVWANEVEDAEEAEAAFALFNVSGGALNIFGIRGI